MARDEKMDSKRLKALIDLVSSSSIAELEITDGDERVRIVKATTSSPCTPAGGADTVPGPAESSLSDQSTAGHVVAAPTYGILHLSAAPEEPPFVSVGDEVVEGQKLCLIEAMKVFSTVASDRSGRVSAVLATSGSEIEAGQPLFRIQ